MKNSETSRRGRMVWRVLKIVLGTILGVLGVVGLFVPVLQGLLFLVLALALLASEIPWLRRLQHKLRRRYPGPWERAEQIRKRARAWLERRFGKKDLSGDEGRGF